MFRPLNCSISTVSERRLHAEIWLLFSFELLIVPADLPVSNPLLDLQSLHSPVERGATDVKSLFPVLPRDGGTLGWVAEQKKKGLGWVRDEQGAVAHPSGTSTQL